MAPRITNTEEYWFIFRNCSCKGFWPPRIPIYWVMGVLKEVGGFLLYQFIGIFMFGHFLHPLYISVIANFGNVRTPCRVIMLCLQIRYLSIDVKRRPQPSAKTVFVYWYYQFINMLNFIGIFPSNAIGNPSAPQYGSFIACICKCGIPPLNPELTISANCCP